MTIDGGTAIILAYVLVSIGVIIASLLAARPIGWFIDRLRERRHGQRAAPQIGSRPAARITLRQGARVVYECGQWQ